MNKRYCENLGATFILPLVFLWLFDDAKSFDKSKPTGSTLSDSSIKIESIFTFLGEAAVFGKSALDGVTMAIAEVNGTGGSLGKPIALVSEDDRGDPAEGARVPAKLTSKTTRLLALLGQSCRKYRLLALP